MTSATFTIVTLGLTSLSQGVTLSLPPEKDNVIYEDPEGGLSNALGANLFAGLSGEGRKLRTLIRFDISGIPTGSIVNSVSFNLTANHCRRTETTVQTNLHRLLGDWGEGTSTPSDEGGGRGGLATSGDATWIHQFSANDFWNTAGGDLTGTSIAPLDVTENTLNSWTSTELANDVQGFVDGDCDNFGWILLAEPGASSKKFFSGDSAIAGNRPQLFIGYTAIPEPGIHSLLAALVIPALL